MKAAGKTGENALLEVYSDFSEGDMTLEEFRELIYEECGIRFQKETD